MYILGYLPRDGRIYLADKDLGVVSFALSLSVVEYQTLVLRGDMDSASEVLADIPSDQMNKIARFLEGQGYKDLALEVATDQEHRFDLSLSLGKLDIALEIARKAETDHKWKTVGDAALTAWDLALAEECFTNAKDLGSLLLLHSSSCSSDGLRKLAAQGKEAGAHNIAFSALWQLADVDGCIDLLTHTNRIAEAVLFAQTYKPSRAPEIAKLWKEDLEKSGKAKVARLVGMPPGVDGADDELFPEWDEYLKLEAEGGSTNDLIDVNGGEEASPVNGSSE
jgi:coatomer subunit beta'